MSIGCKQFPWCVVMYRPAASSRESGPPFLEIHGFERGLLWYVWHCSVFGMEEGVGSDAGGWDCVRLLVLGVGKDALGLESSPGLLKSPCLNARSMPSASLSFSQV